LKPSRGIFWRLGFEQVNRPVTAPGDLEVRVDVAADKAISKLQSKIGFLAGPRVYEAQRLAVGICTANKKRFASVAS